MSGNSSSSECSRAEAREFRTTHWSVVLAAGDTASPQADMALEKLCRTYSYPLYAYIRRRGRRMHDAQDLTQGFLACLLQRHAFRSVVPGRAKFRSFLLASLDNFLADEHDRQQAQKRGGGLMQWMPRSDTAWNRLT
jgi:RNA polymerase sigma-70 factor (ECF subfamily)